MSSQNTPSTSGDQTTIATDEGAAAAGAPGDTAGDPDAIRAEIERTRSDLSRDVNALGEAVSPGSIAKRQTSKARTKVQGTLMKAKVRVTSFAPAPHGPRASTPDSASDTGVVPAAPGVWDRTSTAVYVVVRRTRGNPAAVGVIALAAGWLLGHLTRSPRRGSGRRR